MMKFDHPYDKMSDDVAKSFIAGINRAEAFEDPRVWSKAVRSVLLELNYDPNWIEGRFRELLDSLIFNTRQ